MTLGELVRVALESIRSHALRSFLTLLGVIIGVMTIVGVASVISGLNAYVSEKVIRLAPDVYVLTKFGVIRSRAEFLDAIKRPDISWHEFERLAARLALAQDLGADTTTRAAVRHRDRRLADVVVHGSTANYGTLAGIAIESGRFFSEHDDQAALPVAVIGWDVRDELFAGLDPIGRTLRVGDTPFRVIGVVERQGKMLGQSQDNQVIVPLQTFRRAYGSRRSLDILIRARGGVPAVERSADEARAVLRALRHTPFRAPDPFGIVTVEILQTLWRQISAAAFVLTLLISAVSLGVGGVVIMNIMLVGVVERTREIGVRLALGARKRDIRRQFLLEAALLATAGGAIGIAFGYAATRVVRGALGFPAVLTPAIVGIALALSTAVGLAAGYWPARSASNLTVVDALREE